MIYSRKRLENLEAKRLATYAVKSGKSWGRVFPEPEDENRLCFQKDKERVIHCRAFRRLDQKTQVFMAGSGDHYRTRLTHTLEVAQIGRDIARRMGLNEDLCEVIALAHDLGHPPFGHSGEEALDEVLKGFGMHFEHNQQSKRIVESLEKSYPLFDGLNLSVEVLDGLVKHQTAFDQAGKKFELSSHLEAQVVNIADEIAYTNHDMDDGLRSGLIKVEDLQKFALWKLAEREICKKYDVEEMLERVFISRVISTILSLMIEDLCLQTERNLEKYKVRTVEDVKKHQGSLASFSPAMKKKIRDLRRFLFEHFYMNRRIMKFTQEGKKMIQALFKFYLANPAKFPKERKFVSEEERVLSIKDYIAGMTDLFLRKEYERFIIGRNNGHKKKK